MVIIQCLLASSSIVLMSLLQKLRHPLFLTEFVGQLKEKCSDLAVDCICRSSVIYKGVCLFSAFKTKKKKILNLILKSNGSQ